MPLSLALHFAIEMTHTGMLRDFLSLGGVRLNFPEFTWSVSYFIVELLMLYKNIVCHTHGAINMLFNTIVTNHYEGREDKHGYHLLYLILSMY